MRYNGVFHHKTGGLPGIQEPGVSLQNLSHQEDVHRKRQVRENRAAPCLAGLCGDGGACPVYTGVFCCRIAIHEEARWNIEPVTSRAFAAYGRVVSGFEEECAALVQAVTEHTPLPERLAYIELTGENTDVSVQL